MRMPFLQPLPCFVIVDQFEELLRRYPHAVLWASNLINQQIRNNIARLIFVVNTDSGAMSLLNLCWNTQRAERIMLLPLHADKLGPTSCIDRAIFTECRGNIGLYRMVHDAMR